MSSSAVGEREKAINYLIGGMLEDEKARNETIIRNYKRTIDNLLQYMNSNYPSANLLKQTTRSVPWGLPVRLISDLFLVDGISAYQLLQGVDWKLEDLWVMTKQPPELRRGMARAKIIKSLLYKDRNTIPELQGITDENQVYRIMASNPLLEFNVAEKEVEQLLASTVPESKRSGQPAVAQPAPKPAAVAQPVLLAAVPSKSLFAFGQSQPAQPAPSSTQPSQLPPQLLSSNVKQQDRWWEEESPTYYQGQPESKTIRIEGSEFSSEPSSRPSLFRDQSFESRPARPGLFREESLESEFPAVTSLEEEQYRREKQKIFASPSASAPSLLREQSLESEFPQVSSLQEEQYRREKDKIFASSDLQESRPAASILPQFRSSASASAPSRQFIGYSPSGAPQYVPIASESDLSELQFSRGTSSFAPSQRQSSASQFRSPALSANAPQFVPSQSGYPTFQFPSALPRQSGGVWE